METIDLNAPSGRSQILVGAPLASLTERLNGAAAVIITDRTVRRLHGLRFPPGAPVFLAGRGEKRKSLRTAAGLTRRLLRHGVDRSSWVIGIGGGIVCDIAGFVAATTLRGLPLALAPTTLLAQADAAVGGKNGVNVRGYKNMAGTVRQPRFVISDPAVLLTLPPSERRCGFAEIIKAGVVADAGLFEFLERHAADLVCLDPGLTARAIAGAVRIKAAVVGRDEDDRGERKILNFGHTLGHALEKVERVPHGFAVAAGMSLAADISVRRGLLTEPEAQRLDRLLLSFGLPTRIGRRMKRKKILDAVAVDKKRDGESIAVILLQGIGRAVIASLSAAEIAEALHDLR